MSSIATLENLPLSTLLSAPLVAAVDASLQAQSSKLTLLLSTGFDDEGDLIMVSFDYPTTDIDPETGEAGRVVKQVEVPLLAFLSLPDLIVDKIEQSFSAQITSIQETEQEDVRRVPFLETPYRLNASPSARSTPFLRQTEAFDLDIRMEAAVLPESTGLDILERATNSAVQERMNEEKTEQIRGENE